VLLHGEGRSAWPAFEDAVRRGLDVRIGLEDVLVHPDGAPAADNAARIIAARSIIRCAAQGGHLYEPNVSHSPGQPPCSEVWSRYNPFLMPQPCLTPKGIGR
jgi:hypothetical protein